MLFFLFFVSFSSFSEGRSEQLEPQHWGYFSSARSVSIFIVIYFRYPIIFHETNVRTENFNVRKLQASSDYIDRIYKPAENGKSDTKPAI